MLIFYQALTWWGSKPILFILSIYQLVHLIHFLFTFLTKFWLFQSFIKLILFFKLDFSSHWCSLDLKYLHLLHRQAIYHTCSSYDKFSRFWILILFGFIKPRLFNSCWNSISLLDLSLFSTNLSCISLITTLNILVSKKLNSSILILKLFRQLYFKYYNIWLKASYTELVSLPVYIACLIYFN